MFLLLTLEKDYNLYVAGNVFLTNLPTSDPLVPGALWNDGNTIKISDG